MSQKGKYYITTPIYYPSAKLHIGHTYCTTIADSEARFHRLDGDEVFFLTGSDEHGQKIEQKAEAEGVTPLEYTTRIVSMFKQLWKELNISNDDFIRTTEERHKKVVQALFQRAYDKGDIYLGKYEGWYCIPDETFWPENKLTEEHVCPDCGRPLQRVSEEAYFFKMSKYADRWLKFIEENPGFIQPESRRTNIRLALEYLTNVMKRRCTAFILSDFIDQDNFKNALTIANRKHDVVALQVYDRRVSDLPPVGLMRIKDAETGHEQWIDTSSKAVRRAHRDWWINKQTELNDTFTKSNVDSVSVRTDQDYVKALLNLFAKRN